MNSKINEVVERKANAQKPVLDNWDKVKDIFGENVKTDEIESTKKDHDLIKAKLVKDIIVEGSLAGLIKPEDAEQKEKDLMEKSAKDLLEKFEEYSFIVDEKFPGIRVVNGEGVVTKEADPEGSEETDFDEEVPTP